MNNTNYNKMFNKANDDAPVDKGSLEIEMTSNVIEETVEETPVKKGKVVNCGKLNIRKEPSAEAEIVGTIIVGSEVTILDEVGDFYQIEPGEGNYCMKKYISVQ